jgi:hypothetical protein
MAKKIILFLLIILILAISGIAGFWFFKSSTIKKEVLKSIAASDGKASMASIDISGFPFKQNIIVKNLQFNLSPDINLPQISQLSIPSGYKLSIAEIAATSGLFNNDFVVTKIGQIAFQAQDELPNKVLFNQQPKISFAISGAGLNKFSYQDQGYEIIDVGNNKLFSGSGNILDFALKDEGKNYRGLLKANFKNIKSFADNFAPEDIAAAEIVIDEDLAAKEIVPEIIEDAPAGVLGDVLDEDLEEMLVDEEIEENYENEIAAEEKVEEGKEQDVLAQLEALDQKEIEENIETDVVEISIPEVEIDNKPAEVLGKNLDLDIEYVFKKAQIEIASEVGENIDNLVQSTGGMIQSLKINNITVSIPPHKFSIQGNITDFSQNLIPNGDINLTINNFDEALSNMQKIVEKRMNYKGPEILEDKNQDIADENIEQELEITAENTGLQKQAEIYNPAAAAVKIIKDLSAQNPSSSGTAAVFNFKKEAQKDVLINGVAMQKLIMDFMTSGADQQIEDAAAEEEGEIAQPLDAPVEIENAD